MLTWDDLKIGQASAYMLELTQDKELVDRYTRWLRDNIVNVNYIAILVKKWGDLPTKETVDVAVEINGLYRASNFIMLMDYLYELYSSGELDVVNFVKETN